jgi:hypothetical protein
MITGFSVVIPVDDEMAMMLPFDNHSWIYHDFFSRTRQTAFTKQHCNLIFRSKYTLYHLNTPNAPTQTKRTVTRHQECCVTKSPKTPTAQKTPPFYPCQIYIPLVQNNFITSFPRISRPRKPNPLNSQKKKRRFFYLLYKTSGGKRKREGRTVRS